MQASSSDYLRHFLSFNLAFLLTRRLYVFKQRKIAEFN